MTQADADAQIASYSALAEKAPSLKEEAVAKKRVPASAVAERFLRDSGGDMGKLDALKEDVKAVEDALSRINALWGKAVVVGGEKEKGQGRTSGHPVARLVLNVRALGKDEVPVTLPVETPPPPPPPPVVETPPVVGKKGKGK